uniref:Myosin regulatory light chain 2 n=1 Tax=Cacopsylla melanoneura TaxID=428564 RepID=A0A8D8ZZP3_9HEMI
MADKEKKPKKKKSTKEEAPAAEEAAPAPAPEPESAPVSKPASTRASSRSSSKKAKRSGSTVFSMFSTGQIAEFKEGFAMMDADKDGILGKNDLIKIYDTVGKLVAEKEVDDMLAEGTGPINFTQLLTLFANRMSGGATDDDEVVIAAFKAFDESGVINSVNLRKALMTWGDKFTKKEVDEAFDAMEIDKKGMIDTEALVQMLIGGGDEDA